MESISALFVASYKQPATRHQMAKFIAYWGRSKKTWCPYADDVSILEGAKGEDAGGMAKSETPEKEAAARDIIIIIVLCFVVFSISYGKKTSDIAKRKTNTIICLDRFQSLVPCRSMSKIFPCLLGFMFPPLLKWILLGKFSSLLNWILLGLMSRFDTVQDHMRNVFPL